MFCNNFLIHSQVALESRPTFLSCSLANMKVIYLSENADFGKIDITQSTNQNKYGTMYSLNEKIELVTTEQVADYHVRKGENDKMFLCFSSSQIKKALKTISSTLTADKGLTFKPEKDKIYLKINAEQFQAIPKSQKLNLAINIYGVFTQSSSNASFLQMELSTFKAYPLVNFDYPESDDAKW